MSLLEGTPKCAAEFLNTLPYIDSSHSSREQSAVSATIKVSSDGWPKKVAQPFEKSVVIQERPILMMDLEILCITVQHGKHHWTSTTAVPPTSYHLC